MAKSQDTVIVYGESFAAESPRARKERAAELVNKVLGAKYEPTEAQQLACTELKAPADLLAALARVRKEMSDASEVELTLRRCHDYKWWHIDTKCWYCERESKSLAGFADIWWDGNNGDPYETLSRSVSAIFGSCVLGRCERKTSKMPDGITVGECLRRYEHNQRCDVLDNSGRPGVRYRLTETERWVAQSAWSLALRTKQAEARRVEREQVVCDEQWGEEL